MNLTQILKEIYLNNDCGCGCGGCKLTPTLTESQTAISENLQYHINEGIMLSENEFRIGSEAYMKLFTEARSLYKEGKLQVGSLDKALLETNLGEFGLYEGENVPLDLPMLNEEEINEEAKKAKKKNTLSNILNEIGDASLKPYEWTVKRSSSPSWDLGMEKPFIEVEYKFTTDKGVKYKAGFSEEEEHGWFHFAFYPEGGGIKDIVNKGEVFRVMSTIVDIFKDFIEKEEWNEIYYSSVRQNYGDKRREKLYMAYLKNNLPDWIKIEDIGLGDIALKNQKQDLNEAKKKAKKKDNRPIGKPIRSSSGGKAYKVYVRDPKTKKIKTVRFGSGGLRAKIKDKDARTAFAKRHNCDQKKDRTKAGYWSCNLPRYAKALGLGNNMNTYW